MTKLYCLALLFVALTAGAQTAAPDTVAVQWDHVQLVSKTTLTLQVVVNPPLRRGSPIHDSIFAALRNMSCDYVHYVPWLPYPRPGVEELRPPACTIGIRTAVLPTSWENTIGRAIIMPFPIGRCSTKWTSSIAIPSRKP